MTAPARQAAFRALRDVATGRADLGEALHRARAPLSDPRDLALAMELATGTRRWQGALDYQLQKLSAKPLARLDAAVADALRLGAYQILFLQRVPVSAAVNDAVSIVKASGFRSAGGFVNAVLRRLARERETLSWPGREDLAAHLAAVQSHPRWLVERWLARYGADATEQWLRFNNAPPALTLAPNRQQISQPALIARLMSEGVTAEPAPVAPHGVIVREGRPLHTAAFAEGLFVVQDEASQLVGELIAAAPGQRVLDVCAAPGGKTLAAAAQCAPGGLVVAGDVRPRRVALLAETLARCRASGIGVVHLGAEGTLPLAPAAFDRVLVDAPCSGLGTVRRDPDIRWRRTAGDFVALTAVQIDLLRRVAPHVAPGGRLIYSTCSSEPEENEAVVAAFLAEAGSFFVLPLSAAGVPPVLLASSTPEGYLRTTPARGLEAFFGAILQKK